MDIKRIRSICENYGYVFEQFGGIPRLILVGEQHQSEDHFRVQEELIKDILPSVVLHELYSPNFHDSHRLSETWFGNSSQYKIKRIKELSKEFGFELLPGDISIEEGDNLEERLNEIFLNMGWPDEISRKTHFFSRLIYAKYYSRLIVEPLMGLRLQNALNKNEGDIMGIFGANHLRPDSQIHSVLRLKFPPLGEDFVIENSTLFAQDYITINQDE